MSLKEFVKMNIMSDSRDMHFDKTYTGILWDAEALKNAGETQFATLPFYNNYCNNLYSFF